MGESRRCQTPVELSNHRGEKEEGEHDEGNKEGLFTEAGRRGGKREKISKLRNISNRTLSKETSEDTRLREMLLPAGRSSTEGGGRSSYGMTMLKTRAPGDAAGTAAPWKKTVGGALLG